MNPNPAFAQPPATSNAKEALNVPSVLLLVSGGIGVVMSLARMVMGAGQIAGNPALEQMARNDPNAAATIEKLTGLLTGPLFIMGNLLGLAISGFVIFGALKMRNLQGYGLAMGAAIVSIIPCSGCCCIGMPVGIWALVTLMKPEVKSQFQV